MIFVLPVYNNEAEVKHFIYKELFTQTYTDVHIYVVVNGGSFLIEKNQKVTILHPEKNEGYLGALRYVVETINPNFEFITLCNTDLHFEDENFLSRFVNAINNKEFAVAGPRIFSQLMRTEQSPLYINRMSKKKLSLIGFFYSNPLLYFLYHSLFYIKKSLSGRFKQFNSENPYALQGSFMTLSKRYFEKGGTLNYPVLIYGEESFLAEEALRIGLKNIFVSSLKIIHFEHATTAKFNFKHLASMKKSVEFLLKNYY